MSERLEPEDFSNLVNDNGPAAIVMVRELEPVEGREAWIFPPTFARSESDEDSDGESKGGYQIDDLGAGRNVCLLDSIGSQANRMEPIFKDETYKSLVPQVTVKMDGENRLNLLDLGHRAADAAIRFTDKGEDLFKAFRALSDSNDCTELARIAPTSLVFGVWDSRGTQVKTPRIVRSIIRAYDVKEARRSATYRASYDYVANDLINEKFDKGSGKKNALSQEGFKYSLATDTHGGVMVLGSIKQEAIINLVSLRSLSNDSKVRCYLLGLALLSLSYRDQRCFNLREGCLLKAKSPDDFEGRWRTEYVDSTSKAIYVRHGKVLEFAKKAATEFGVGSDREAKFDKETAEAWLGIDKDERKKCSKQQHPKQAVGTIAKKSAKKKGAKADDVQTRDAEDTEGAS